MRFTRKIASIYGLGLNKHVKNILSYIKKSTTHLSAQRHTEALSYTKIITFRRRHRIIERLSYDATMKLHGRSYKQAIKSVSKTGWHTWRSPIRWSHANMLAVSCRCDVSVPGRMLQLFLQRTHRVSLTAWCGYAVLWEQLCRLMTASSIRCDYFFDCVSK